MIFVDLHDPQRVNKTPDDVEVLLSSGNFVQEDFVISKVELRLYNEKTDEKLGVYSLITSFVQTDKGTIDLKQLIVPNRDMEFQAYSEWLLMKIMSVYGVAGGDA